MLVGPHFIKLSLVLHLPFALKVHVFAFSVLPKGSHIIPSRIHFCKKTGNHGPINRADPWPWGIGWQTRFPNHDRPRPLHCGPGEATEAPLHPGLQESLERCRTTCPIPVERGSKTWQGAVETLPGHLPWSLPGQALPSHSLTPLGEGGGEGWFQPDSWRAERGLGRGPKCSGDERFLEKLLSINALRSFTKIALTSQWLLISSSSLKRIHFLKICHLHRRND